MYHAACKVEFQPFTVVLTADVFNFLLKYIYAVYIYAAPAPRPSQYIDAILLLVIGIDWHFLKLISISVAGNYDRYRLTPSLIYLLFGHNCIEMYYQNFSLKQIAIDRNFQSIPVRAIYYWDCETKPVLFL